MHIKYQRPCYLIFIFIFGCSIPDIKKLIEINNNTPAISLCSSKIGNNTSSLYEIKIFE